MHLVTDPELRGYFERHAGRIGSKAVFLGKWSDHLQGVVAIWNYNGVNCEAGWVGEPGWLTREYLRLVFAYIFDQLGCTRITGRINACNDTALAMSQRLGFVHEGTMRSAAKDGGDVLLFGMLKQECKYYGR